MLMNSTINSAPINGSGGLLFKDMSQSEYEGNLSYKIETINKLQLD